MNLEYNYWKKNMEIYKELPYPKNVKYYCWQPARWSSNRAAIRTIYKEIDDINTVCELGAGSAAFSLEMYNQNNNLNITAIDICEMACKYGKLIADDMKVPINYVNNDFFLLDDSNKYDFVLSLGVIEHFDKEKMEGFIKLCQRISNRYILIAIPNQNSTIFKSYIKWCNKNDNNYEEKHEDLNTDLLLSMLKENGLKILRVDGFQMFLSESDFLQETIQVNKKYINMLKKALVNEDKKFESLYPNYNFKCEDIESMTRAELKFSKNERLEFAFMTYVLCEK